MKEIGEGSMSKKVKAIFNTTKKNHHGFNIIVPENTNSTFDNEFMSAEKTYHYYNEFMWNRRYAQCIPFEEVVEMMKTGKIMR